MAAGRRVCMNNKAVAVVALLALLLAAGEAGDEICKVDRDTVLDRCGKSCSSSGTPSDECCEALSGADFGCLCQHFWGKLKAVPALAAYARCAEAIPSKCGFRNAKCH